jgi:hypothetical protein
MRDYRSEVPITVRNDAATVQVIGRIEKDGNPFNFHLTTRRKT